MNFSTTITILVTFGPETPECMLLTITPFAVIWQKSAYHFKYLCPGPILTYFTGLVGVLVGMIISIFVWRSPKGRCYGNQLNLEDVCRHRQECPLLFTSAFDNWLADRKSAFKRLNGNIHATLCTNLASIHPIISEFTLLKRAIFAAIRPQFYDKSSFITSFVNLAFWNGLEDRNFDFTLVIGNQFCTSCRNSVTIGSVTPEFKT